MFENENDDCDCGMGERCLFIQRKLEALRLIKRTDQPKLELSFINHHHNNLVQSRSSQRLKTMSGWNNIADLTQHRETIKVTKLCRRAHLIFILVSGEQSWSGEEFQCCDLQYPG